MKRGRTHGASAVVTGAGSGIGRAFAELLAERGGRVVCADLALGTAEQTATRIIRAGGRALALPCDVTELAEVERLANEAERWFDGEVDVVVNNAGIGSGGRVVGELTLDDWRATLDVNLWGVIHCCHVFTPRLRRLGRGGIVNVASAAAFMSPPEMAAYNVSKAGVVALSETLAAELMGTDVAVTVLCPTLVKTNILDGARIAPGTARLGKKLMARGGDDPRRVVAAALDLHDAGALYAVPQLDGRGMWLAKRVAPVLYGRALGALAKFGPRRG